MKKHKRRPYKIENLALIALLAYAIKKSIEPVRI